MEQTRNCSIFKGVSQFLLDAAERSDGGDEIRFLTGRSGEDALSYLALLELAQRALFQLSAQGLRPGDHAIIQAGASKTQLALLWGCFLGGIVPALLPRVSSRAVETKEGDRLRGAVAALDRPHFVVPAEDIASLQEADALPQFSSARLVAVDATFAEFGPAQIRLPNPGDCAYIQFSSGSTRIPKGVQLSHGNLLNNVSSMIYSGGFTRQNGTCVNWMPYSHDMGLIGFHLLPLALRAGQVKLEALDFLRDPMHWLRALDRFGAGNTGSPNFGLEHVLDRLSEAEVRSLDLSRLRIFTGAEPIRPGTLTRFARLMAHAGLAETAICPVYGLAEVCVGAITPDTRLPPRLIRFDRKALREDARAVPVAGDAGDMATTTLVALGQPIRDMDLSVRDAENHECPPGAVGEICLRGPSVMIGYLNAEQAVDAEGWLHTGDLGVLHEGDLFVTGRRKNLLIVNGCKLMSSDVEEHLSETLGLSAGTVAVATAPDASGEDRITVFVQKRRLATLAGGDMAQAARIVARVAASYVEGPVHRVVPVSTIPRTTSGKIQNFSLSKQMAAGAFDAEAIDPSAPLAVSDESVPEPGALRLIVRRLWCELLEIDDRQFDDNVPFAALGGSSVKAFRFISRLEAELARPLATDVLIDCRTVAEIVAALGDARADRPMPASESARATADHSVAVVGMAGRFPDAPDLERYWQNLCSGRVSTRPAPFALADGSPCYWAPLDDKASFSAAEFGIADDEATIMDPAQRIMLELALEALEDAGLNGLRLPRNARVGVYVGAGYSSNAAFLEQADLPEHLRRLPEMLVANLPNIVAARISKHFGFRGPALTVDTACSSSLVALHYACRDLTAGLSDVALVGGVNLINGPAQHQLLAQAGAVSRSGQSVPLSVEADGIVPGEGAGMVVLRRLEDAQAQRDRIDAVILSTTVNNDGRSLSLMAPNAEGQERLLVHNIAESGCNAADIGLIEAHMTGTQIGDPVELRSMARSFAALGAGQGCRIGTVKANIGHLLAAAGIASFIKTVLALRNAYCPPLPVPKNGLIDFAGTGLVPSEGAHWAQAGGKPLALVNSFGFGGTNAQAILAPGQVALDDVGASGVVPLILEAASPAALVETAQMVRLWLNRHPEVSLPSLARTLWLRNRDGAARVAMRVATLAEALDRLAAPNAADLSEDDPLAAWCAGRPVDLAKVFDAVADAAPLPLPSMPRRRSRFALTGQFPDAAPTDAPFEADMRFGGALGRDLAHWLYQTEWEPADLKRNAPAQGSGAIALVARATQDVDAVTEGLGAIGAEPRVVRVPDGDDAQASTLRKALADGRWHKIFDLRALEANPDDLAHPGTTGEAALKALMNFQRLAIQVRSLPGAPRLIAVTARDRGHIAAEMLWAFTRSLDLEWASGTFGCLQLDRAALAAEAMTEVALADARGSLRWTDAGPRRERLAQAALGAPDVFSLRGKSAIIVGGAGGIGRFVAADLSRRGVTKLYLTGRRSVEDLPEDVAAAFDTLRRAGTEVDYLRLDLLDEAAMASFAAQLAAHPVAPGLVVHAATDAIFVDAAAMDRTEVDRQCMAKIVGTLSLIRHLAPILDGRMVLFGSLTGLTGGKGQSLYAAANRGQGAIMELARSGGTDVRLINWGVWKGTGQARDLPGEILGAVADSGSLPMEVAEALELFARLLDHDTPTAMHVANVSHAKARSLGVASAVAQGEALCSAHARLAQVAPVSPAHAALHDYCALRLLAEFCSGFEDFGAPTTRAELRERMRVGPDRMLHLDRVIDILCEDGFLRETGLGQLEAGHFPDLGRAARLRAEVCDHHPEGRRIVDYIDHCIARLPEVLSGQAEATAVLCPGGNTDDLALLYRLDDGLQTAQEMVARVLAEYATPDFDILEIGAGTGALTDTVLAHLRGARGHYLFTDIGQGFLNRARQHYRDEDHFAVARFDLEQPPARQGLGDIRIDAVIGTNVLHAVGDLVPAINRLRGMLNPGGWLILVETFGPHRAADCTVGMFDGWWAFRDHAVRPNYPLLGVRNWQAVLSRAGFDVTCVPAKATAGQGEVETGVVLARLLAAAPDQTEVLTAPDRAARFAALGGDASPVKEQPPAQGTAEPSAGSDSDWILSILHGALALSGMHEVDPDAEFFDIGLDSITALEVVGRIEAELKVSLSPAAFFEFSSLRAMSVHLSGLNPQLGGAASVEASAASDAAVTVTATPSGEAPQDYPLSEAAMRMWIANGLQDDAATYNIENAIRFEGRLQLDALEQALKTVIGEQDGLRCRLVQDRGAPRIKISDAVIVNLRHVDLRDLAVESRDAALDTIRIEDKHTAFDLAREPPLRVTLVRLSKFEHVLVTVMHHLFSDGWSLTLLVRRVAELYNALVFGQPLPEPRGDMRLRDCLHDNRPGVENTAALAAAMAQLGSDVEPVSLPWDRAPGGSLSGAGHLAMASLGRETTALLRKAAAEAEATLFQMASGLFATWLCRISGQDSVSFVTPSAGRDDIRLQDLIGFFVNMLPIRMEVRGDLDLTETAKAARRTCDAAFDRRSVGFERIVASLESQRAPLAPQPFNTALIVQGRQWSTGMRLSYAGLTAEPLPEIAPSALYDLTLFLRETDDDIRVELNGACDVFDRATVETLLRYFVEMLRNALRAPDQPVYAAPMSDPLALADEADRALADAMALVHSNRVEAQFEAVAARQGDRLCLADGDRFMTYAEVDAAANRLARAIRQTVREAEGLVALWLPRNLECVVAMLAVAKAGLGYMPLSVEDGPDRLRHILSVSRPILAIVDRSDLPRWVGGDMPRLDLTADAAFIGGCNAAPLPQTGASAAAPLYVLFTSGSTGEPKGVEIRHDNVLSLVCNSEGTFGFAPEDAWSCLHAFTFDFSTWEIWGPLLTGGSMWLASDQVRRDPQALAAFIGDHGVTVMNVTPNVFYQFDLTMSENPQLEARHRIRQVIFGGDRLSPARLAGWVRRNPLERTALCNCFGITETTVHVTGNALTPEDIDRDLSVIGGPLPGYAILLRDKLGQPIVPGLPGEIWVGGAGVANGYLGQPTLTAERFRRLPGADSGGPILFRSGDLARQRLDGRVEYLGRADRQLKFLGYRIEPGEIETALLTHPDILEAFVLVGPDSAGQAQLAAFLVAPPEIPKDIAGLRDFLGPLLPPYMCPTRLIRIEQMPINRNGKVDRGLLLRALYTEAAGTRAVIRDAATETEAGVIALFAEVLGRGEIGRHSGFFDIGGNSILAGQLHNRLCQRFAVSLELRDVFLKATPAELASVIDAFTPTTPVGARASETGEI